MDYKDDNAFAEGLVAIVAFAFIVFGSQMLSLFS